MFLRVLRTCGLPRARYRLRRNDNRSNNDNYHCNDGVRLPRFRIARRWALTCPRTGSRSTCTTGHVPLPRRLTSPCRAGSRPLAAPAHVPLPRRLTSPCRAGSRPLVAPAHVRPFCHVGTRPRRRFRSRPSGRVGSRPSFPSDHVPLVTPTHVPLSRRITSPAHVGSHPPPSLSPLAPSPFPCFPPPSPFPKDSIVHRLPSSSTAPPRPPATSTRN